VRDFEASGPRAPFFDMAKVLLSATERTMPASVQRWDAIGNEATSRTPDHRNSGPVLYRYILHHIRVEEVARFLSHMGRASELVPTAIFCPPIPKLGSRWLGRYRSRKWMDLIMMYRYLIGQKCQKYLG
jgi:hypothetical protein